MNAQTGHYTGWGGVDISGTTLRSPFGVSVSSGGEAYVGDSGNSRILQLTPSTGLTSTVYQYNSSSNPGCGSPQYPAVDSSGNVYFTCRDTTAIYKSAINSGVWNAATQIYNSNATGTGGRGTHMDSSNNLWIVEIDNNNGQEPFLLKCSSSSCSTFYTFPSAGSLGLSNTVVPEALTQDANGNWYISDIGNGVVLKLTNSGSVSSPVAGSMSVLFTGTNCYGIAVDASGNVYLGTNGPSITKETYSGGSYTASTITTIPGLLTRSVGIALDPTGTVIYAADYTDGGETINGVTGPSPASTNFIRFGTTPQTLGSVGVGVTSSTLSMSFTFDTGGMLGSIAVLTQGISGLDFNNASTGTCTAGTTYSTSATCTVNVTFTPTKVGLRYGAVVLKNSSGTPFATGYVYGTGTGAVLDFSPVSQTTLDSSAAGAEGIVGDAAGNLYIAAGSAVYKEAYSAGTYTRSTLFTSALGTNFSSLQALAIDGAGNLYLGDGGNSRIIKETLAGGTYTPQVICTANSSNGIYCGANEVAVDVAGNVYYLSGNTSSVNKITFEPTPQSNNNNTYYSLPVNIATNNNNPWGVAVDASGNVYYTTANTSNPTCVLYKLTPAGASYVQTALDSTLSDPTSISLDGLGNIYIAQDTGTSGSVVKETYVSGTTYTRSTLISSISNPVGVWADTSGNVFATSQGSGTLVELAYAGPPSLNFSSTNVGSTSASQTVTIQNVGNAALTFPIPSSGNTNPAVSTNFGWTTTGGSACPALTSSSVSAGTLAAGSTCTYPIYFAPVSGTSDTGTFVITDNSASGTTQTINLSGTATYASAPTVTGVSPGSGTLLGGTTVTITGTNLLGATAVSFGGMAATITSVGSTQVVATSPAVSGAGTVNVQVTTPGGTSTITSSDDYVFTKATKTITFTQPAAPVLEGATATLSATASNGDAVTFSIVGGTGTATVSGSQITYTGAGTVIIEADSAATSTYFAAAAVQQTVTVPPVAPAYIVTVATDPSTGNGTASNCVDPNISSSGNTNCSLRDAVAAANALSGVTTNITFASSLTSGATTSSPVVIQIAQSTPITMTASMNITGPGANLLIIEGGTTALSTSNKQIFQMSGGTSTLSSVTVANGYTTSGGGGLFQSGGTLTVTNCTFSGNRADGGSGGGIYSYQSSGTTILTVTNSTFSNNSAPNGSGGAFYGFSPSNTLAVTNSTFTGNESRYGGAIVGYTMTVANSTFSANSAVLYGGAIYSNHSITLSNSILSGDTANVSGSGIYATNSVGSITNTVEYGDTNYGVTTSNILSSNPNLSALGYYGGSTQTMLPLPGSSAICAGSLPTASTDQRGVAISSTRYGQTGCYDVGAVQTSYALAFTTSPGNTLVGASLSPSPVVTLSENGMALTAGSASVTVSAAAGSLSGTTTHSTSTTAGPTAGQASFSGLSISATETADTLTATLALTSSINLTATSSNFNVTAPAPTITGISPNYGPIAGGTTVTITGTNFTGTQNVYFLNCAVNSTATFTVVNSTTITAVSTADGLGTSCQAQVSVLTPGGTSNAVAFNYYTPTLTSLMVSGYSAHGIVTEGGSVTVTAYDQYSSVFTGFTGSVALTSSDTHATLPSAYTFQLSDAGVHAFNVTLNTVGTQSITATSGSVSGSQAGIVVNDAIWVLNTAGTLNKLNAGGAAVMTGIGSSGTAASYGGAAIDSSGNAWSVSTASNTLYFASYMGVAATSYTGGGLNAPSSVAVDGAGYVWVANQSGNTVSEFTNAGGAQSTSSGYGSSYLSGDTLNAPSSIAIDQTGGVWVTNKSGNTVTHIFGAAAPVVTPLSTATANGTQGTRP